MSEQKPPASDNMGGMHVTIHGDAAGVGTGAHGTINKQTYITGSQPIDMKAFQDSLLELHTLLGSALPGRAGIKAQTAVGQAMDTAEQPDAQPTAVKEHLEQIGSALKQANVAVERGSQLAASLEKIARVAAPFLGLAAHAVGGMLGLPWL
jgi:hypothetical protein